MDKRKDGLSGIPAKVIAALIGGIREDSKSVSVNGGVYELKGGHVYWEGEKLWSKEAVRVAWRDMDKWARLYAEAAPIDILLPTDMIIFRPIEAEAFAKSKLLLPDQAKKSSMSIGQVYKEMPLQGIVVALGPGYMTDTGILKPLGCGIGDHILLRVGSGLISDFLFEGVLYYWTRSSELLGVSGMMYRDYLAANYDLRFTKL